MRATLSCAQHIFIVLKINGIFSLQNTKEKNCLTAYHQSPKQCPEYSRCAINISYLVNEMKEYIQSFLVAVEWG